MKHLMWDIDGTLLLTGGAGINAMKSVITVYYGLKNFEFDQSLSGKTDCGIIRRAVLRVRKNFSAADVEAIMALYHKELPKFLPLYEGRLMKNVKKTLSYFAHSDSYENCLLTGNTKTAAKLKLEHYGLDKFFSFSTNTFGELSAERCDLAKEAWRHFGTVAPKQRPEDYIFIGDTPNDIRCADAIGARCLILLDGAKLKREDFLQYHPWRILDELPDDPYSLEKMFDEP